MSPHLRKLALTAHITVSVGWVGALAAFLALAIAGLVSQERATAQAAYLAMDLAAWFVILPLSLASLLTGVIQAFGTPWGLFRHYWVLAKLVLTALATFVLLLKLEPIRTLAGAAHGTTLNPDFTMLRLSLLVHAVGGLLVLLTITALAVYKPRGLTPFGLRKKANSRDPWAIVGAGDTPRWVKAFGIGASLLLLLLALMTLTGEHGPSAHRSG